MLTTTDAAVLQQFIESSPDSVFIVDRENRYTYLSRGAAAAVGRTPEAMIGHTWRELGLASEALEIAEADWQRVMATGQRARREVQYDTPHGRRSFEYTIFPVGDHAGVIARDITQYVTTSEVRRYTSERYRSFVANSSEAIWRFELDEPIDVRTPVDDQIEQMFARAYLAEGNPVMARMYGYDSADEMIGMRLPDMVDPTQHNRDYLRAFIEGGYVLRDGQSIETDRHGQRKYFVNSLTGIVENGLLLRAWGMQRDVTERRAITEQLRTSESRLQALVTASMQTLWTAIGEGQLTWVAPSWTELTGQTLEQAKGHGWLEVMHPDDGAITFWRAANHRREVMEGAMRVRQRDGSYRWFHVRAVPLFDDDGTLREWIGANTDIDIQHRETEALAARRARAELLAAANDRFMQSLDPDQTLRHLAELTVPLLADWCAVDVTDGAGVTRRVASAPDAKPPHEPSSSLCIPMRLRDGSGVLTLAQLDSARDFDESDAALAEELAVRAAHAVENARSYQQAVAANRAKDEFLATVSHELRTPLTSILGWANLLRVTTMDPDTVRTAIAMIEQGARTQAALIDDLLDVARIVTGRLSLDIQPVDLVQVVENGVAAARPAADAKHIAIKVDAPPSVVVRADGNRMQQIVWNLMSNAVKFSGDGTRIEVSIVREDDGVVLRVRDHGFGIPPELLPRVFDRFWQADTSSHRRHGGLGLGLAIVRHLAELHGGTVAAESDGVGHGSMFTVRLPG